MLSTLLVITYLSCLFVFLPVIKSDFWIFRSLEYSRFQNFILCLILVLLWGAYYTAYHQIDLVAFSSNIVCCVYLLYKILPYTILTTKEVKTVKKHDTDAEIKVINANVLQYNTQYTRLLNQINTYKPDVVLLLETDQKWMDNVQSLKKDYSYFIEVPQDNTYGMLLYSKLKLSDEQVNFFVKDDIPSIYCKVSLKNGTNINLWGLHPEPPVPGEELTSTAKDKELAKVALQVKEIDEPCIVMGDLNDVAWSDTTSLFTKTSGLLDVRKGRGFYSTFSAHHWFIRFPLDYIFCSSHFGFKDMKRLKFNGSDHFPIFTHLILKEGLKQAQQKEKPDSETVKEAKEKSNQPVED